MNNVSEKYFSLHKKRLKISALRRERWPEGENEISWAPTRDIDIDMDNNDDTGRKGVLSSLEEAQIISFKEKGLRKKRRLATCPNY